jgi:hypothetical protein
VSLNAELWSEIPFERWIETEYALALSSGLPLIASVGYTPEEVTELAPKIEKLALTMWEVMLR